VTAADRKAKRARMREQLERARTRALGAAYDFHELTEVHEDSLDVRKLGRVAQAVILAAAEVRIATRAIELAKRGRA